MVMEGVEVLNQVEILAHPEWTWIKIALIVCFIAFIIGIAGCLISIIMTCEDKISLFFMGFTVISFFLIAVFIALAEKPTVPTGKYEYQVTIDDSVSMNKFYEKYEIVEVNGKIYTIREKE